MIVHLSLTPLVGSPGKIAKLINNNSLLKSVHYCENDYPGDLSKLFLSNTICLNENESVKECLYEDLKKSDVVHIHNEISKDMVDFIYASVNKYTMFYYQTHSPLREGPNFIDMSKYLGISFDKKLVVAQYHPRLYQDFIPVPNFVDVDSGITLIENNEIPKVLFSPAHQRTGQRWNDKVSKQLNEILSFYHKVDKIKLIQAKCLHPYALMNLRKKCHITIDEIITGSYHQVSLEGLAAGNVVINNADFMSKYYLASFADGNIDNVPFYQVDELNAGERLESLLNDNSIMRSYQLKAKRYHDKHLGEKSMYDIYRGIYGI